MLAAYEKKKNTPEAEEEQEVGGNAAFDERLAEVLQCMANDPTNEDEFHPLKVGLEKLKKRQYQRRLKAARRRGILAIAAKKENKRKQLERKRKKTNVGEGQGSTPLLPCRGERRTGRERGGQGGRRAAGRAIAPAPAVEPPPAVEPASVVVCGGGAGGETAPPAAKPSAAVLPPVPPAAGPGAAPRVLEVELAVVFLLKVLRKGDHNRLADIKQHVATGEDFFVRSRNIVYPAEALRIALSQYEEEVRTSKPATLPAAPAASSPAAEEVAAPPPGKRQRLEVPDEKKALLNKGGAELQIYHGRANDLEPQFKMICKSCGATCSRAIHKASLGHLLAWGHLPCNGVVSKHNDWKMKDEMLPHAKRQEWLTWAESHLRFAWDEQQRLRQDGRQDEPIELKG